MVTGTTGESPVLTDDERTSLYREALRAADGRARIVAGTGGYNTAESVGRSRVAADLGVDGLLQVTPYYNRPPQDGLYEHFRVIAEATPLPNILYNVPSRTNCNIEPQTVSRLSEIANIVGIKEASGDFDQIAEILRTSAKGFQVYSGNDSDTYLIMALGGVGVVSVASHLVSGEIRHMIDTFVEGNIQRSLQMHLHLLPISRALFPPGWANPVAVKAALNCAGFQAGEPRLPLLKLPADMEKHLATVLEPYELDGFLRTVPTGT